MTSAGLCLRSEDTCLPFSGLLIRSLASASFSRHSESSALSAFSPISLFLTRNGKTVWSKGNLYLLNLISFQHSGYIQMLSTSPHPEVLHGTKDQGKGVCLWPRACILVAVHMLLASGCLASSGRSLCPFRTLRRGIGRASGFSGDPQPPPPSQPSPGQACPTGPCGALCSHQLPEGSLPAPHLERNRYFTSHYVSPKHSGYTPVHPISPSRLGFGKPAGHSGCFYFLSCLVSPGGSATRQLLELRKGRKREDRKWGRFKEEKCTFKITLKKLNPPPK